MEDGAGLRVKVEEEDGDEVFECVACNKTFGSERSWENHERSKRHKQSVFKWVFHGKQMIADLSGSRRR